MFVAEANIPQQWTPLTDLCTVEQDEAYTIANGSTEFMYAIEGSATPEEGLNGVPIAPGKFIVYTKDTQDLYLRNGQSTTPRGNRPCVVTIHKVG